MSTNIRATEPPADADVWHAYDYSGRTHDHAVPGSQRTVYDGCKAIGHVTYTQGEFWNAYSSMSGMGMGPFTSEEDAEKFVHDRNEPVPNYSR